MAARREDSLAFRGLAGLPGSHAAGPGLSSGRAESPPCRQWEEQELLEIALKTPPRQSAFAAHGDLAADADACVT